MGYALRCWPVDNALRCPPALLVFSKQKIQKLVAVGDCGQREALSTGSGWAVLQWKGWVKLEPVGLCPGLPWVQQLYPCLERATGCGAGTPNKNGPKGPQLI